MTASAPPKVGFERILVPIDFTDISQRALDYAKSIARLNESTLFLVHANEAAHPITSPELVWFEQLTAQEPEEQQLKTQAAELHPCRHGDDNVYEDQFRANEIERCSASRWMRTLAP